MAPRLLLLLSFAVGGCATAPPAATIAMPRDALDPGMTLRSEIALPPGAANPSMSLAGPSHADDGSAAVMLPPQCVDARERPRRCRP